MKDVISSAEAYIADVEASQRVLGMYQEAILRSRHGGLGSAAIYGLISHAILWRRLERSLLKDPALMASIEIDSTDKLSFAKALVAIPRQENFE